jgi:hypothetical protein
MRLCFIFFVQTTPLIRVLKNKNHNFTVNHVKMTRNVAVNSDLQGTYYIGKFWNTHYLSLGLPEATHLTFT